MLTADEVLDARFQATKFREGYDQVEVDAFLDRVAVVLRAREAGSAPAVTLTAAEVAAARFQATKFREGYDQDEVDDFLDRVQATLASPAGSAGPAPTMPPAPAPSRGAAPTPGLVDVRRGGLLGLFRRR